MTSELARILATILCLALVNGCASAPRCDFSAVATYYNSSEPNLWPSCEELR